jgi:hypothetical protein
MQIDSEENGTCATIWSLWHAKIKNMQVADLTESFHNAPPLSIDDILHNPIKTAFFNKCLVHSICRMIVTHPGADSFKKFRKDMESNQPRIDQLIELHKTSHHLLPAWNIDQSTIVSNAEVAEIIFDELGVLEKKHALLTWRSAEHSPLACTSQHSHRPGRWLLGLWMGRMDARPISRENM